SYPASANHSFVTTFILQFLSPGSILYSIMMEKDSRRIAYFAWLVGPDSIKTYSLNLAFMLVQFFYGFVSGSLGLLTDSIHMLFDCAGLAVGLAAAVMSKWPPSLNFPYGYGKIDTLSGFANGIFLILVSVEIVFDAVHRLREGHELHRLNELLLVSILGFLVNIVGLTAFGHAHHGHDHGHGHSHSHTADSHEIDLDSNISPKTLLGPPTSSSSPSNPLSASTLSPQALAPPPHSHHAHENENMQGIFLHILADALGSVSVIISTLLTQYTGWHGWDPLASCLISILIFASAVPLVKGAGMKLLLLLPDEVEYAIRATLGELGGMRGVAGYGGCRFWMAETHGPEQTVLGVIHVIASRSADMEDVRERVVQLLKGRGMNVVVHVDREGDGYCWCGVG
ncbi:cation efflux protein, partial [Rhizodiscina lignyota]